MRVTRRGFAVMSGAALAGALLPGLSRAQSAFVTLVLAPSNLGLRPERSKVEPGAWRAPQALMDAGLADELDATATIALERPKYEFDAQPGTRIRNGNTIREFSLELAARVREVIEEKRFPVVIGGDCSILLGCLYGARLAGGRGLVHVDGHSDFFHPGNYDTAARLGTVAGMDLALASGRGEPLLAQWPQIEGPLVRDGDIIQIGERDAGSPTFRQGYGDILDTDIMQITSQRALSDGSGITARRATTRLELRRLDKVWLHVDLDVLDKSVMPAVDSPGSPGFGFDQLRQLVSALVASGRIAGAAFTIYDPNRDPKNKYAQPLAKCIGQGVRQRS